jgi:polysaccharide transporter, PST family
MVTLSRIRRAMSPSPVVARPRGASPLGAFFQRDLTRNALALYGVQFCRKLVPLVSVPYLARTLGPSGWGRVAFALAFGELLVMLIEFGFNLSATREVARHRDSTEHCREIASGVLGAQAVLSLAAIAIALAVAPFVPGLRNYPKLFASGLFYGIAQGIAPLWFFQGMERMRTAAALEIHGKLLGLCCVFAFVHAPADDWKVLLAQALPPAICSIAGIALMRRVTGLEIPRMAGIRAALERGWPMFLFRGGLSLYGVANAFVLGMFAPAAQVGYFASSEKIGKAASGLLTPLRDAIYPRLSRMIRHSPSAARRLAGAGALVSTAAGFFISLTLFVFAPSIVRLLMGPGFAPAVTVLRILSALPFIIAVTESVGLQWLLPQGRDKTVNQIIFSGGFLNLALALVLAPRFAHVGMAWSVVTVESLVALCMSAAALRGTAPGEYDSGEAPAPHLPGLRAALTTAVGEVS